MAHVGIFFCLYDHLKQLKEENIMAYMSEEGYKKLMAELKELETVERPKISAAIAEARDKGDLSENAEYDAAKEAQGMLEMRINKLKATIADAKIIDESKLKTDSVQILNKVELKNVKNVRLLFLSRFYPRPPTHVTHSRRCSRPAFCCSVAYPRFWDSL